MCARYHIDTGVYDDISDITGFQSVEKNVGDVHPSEKAVSVIADSHKMAVDELIWGYPGFKGSGLLINARAETIREKRIFSRGIENFRCVMPARLFYEWDSSKNKVSFTNKDEQVIYLAGCYDFFDDNRCFAIITREANDSVINVHDRMPLILCRDEIEDWLLTDNYVNLLEKRLPELEAYREYDQMTVF